MVKNDLFHLLILWCHFIGRDCCKRQDSLPPALTSQIRVIVPSKSESGEREIISLLFNKIKGFLCMKRVLKASCTKNIPRFSFSDFSPKENQEVVLPALEILLEPPDTEISVGMVLWIHDELWIQTSYHLYWAAKGK